MSADEWTDSYQARGVHLPNRAGDAHLERERLRERITRVEAENAALWAFVKEMRTLQVVLSDTKNPTSTWKAWHTKRFHDAEELIEPYEAQP